MENNSWQAYDDFLFHGDLDRFAKLWARYDLFKKVIDIPGDIVECGVFQGTGVLYWARMVQVFNPLSRRKVIGFDTFSGYPDTDTGAQDLQAGDEFLKKTGYRGFPAADITGIAARLGLDRRVELIEGDALETIPDYVEKNHGFRIALLNLDFDIFKPTLAALKYLYPIVVPGGIIILDEYAVHEWGESGAVDEYFKGKVPLLKSLPWGFSPTAYMIKET